MDVRPEVLPKEAAPEIASTDPILDQDIIRAIPTGTDVLHLCHLLALRYWLEKNTSLMQIRNKNKINTPHLQLKTWRSAEAQTSKRTAPQWQPPVCLTKPLYSLEREMRERFSDCTLFLAKKAVRLYTILFSSALSKKMYPLKCILTCQSEGQNGFCSLQQLLFWFN